MNKVKTENLALAIVNNVCNFKHQTIFYLYKNFNSWINILKATRKELSDLKIPENIINNLQSVYRSDVFKILEDDSISIINYQDPNFPSLLKETKNYPLALFYKGKLASKKNKYFSIVGSRDCSLKARPSLNYLMNSLTNDYSLVSGLAIGVDTLVHQYALDNNFHTCAILGSGINVLYPQTNIGLAKKIVYNQGCIISQFLPFQEPTKYNFPIRNQLIAGFSSNTLILESKIKSGALITANLAIEYGRNVATVPGDIFSKHYQGNNELIKNGAIVINQAQDLKDLLLDSNF